MITPDKPYHYLPQQKSFTRHLLSVLVIFVIMASIAMVHTGRIFGHKLTDATEPEVLTQNIDGEVINTTRLSNDIIGYGGPVPVELYLSDGVVDSVRTLPNHETPQFFNKIYESGLSHKWDKKYIEDAAKLKVDAVTGATYSSKAYIANVQLGLNFALNNRYVLATDTNRTLSWKFFIAVIVILCGAILPFFVRNKYYRLVQQLLNVGVLGFWAGTFIDFTMIINFFSGGITYTLATVVLLLLLIVGFIYPIVGKVTHYCAWICPYGSLQDLAGMLTCRKVKLKPGTVRILTTFRRCLWVVLLSLLYMGIGAAWIDYEIFTAFMVKAASIWVIVAGLLFLLLAVFISRPFCRFVCPTGSLLKLI